MSRYGKPIYRVLIQFPDARRMKIFSLIWKLKDDCGKLEGIENLEIEETVAIKGTGYLNT